ncbi:hypothetical protein PHLGIDRAFT_17589 [Phlebiopsis gigantea 11061_1 CR5-6]|uniref:Uncharacterized protein n=1 Tax=Phlebiopsis gigantea (strain 11061_1 CR5-6) TaxID=745531 RepID=A0A0C3SFP7_PHLG1|nr:hypothetical protein PHLGIDRAFT_17589 [Phlebiopsis gigantea 11061_1 CR5-6]
MTAIFQPMDALRPGEKITVTLDEPNHRHTDWKAKYMEVAEMLTETRAELDDFQISSRELEEELERELERTEKAQQDLKIKAAKADQEKDVWKSKFMSLQTTHNTTTTSLQRELDTVRKDYQQVKIQLRELEMGNDDLERNERAIASSLADIEQKYSRVLEEKILLEHELLDKATVEEECQRLKDELRDANEEIVILKDQLAAALDRAPAEIPPSVTPSRSSQFSEDSDPISSVYPQPEIDLTDFLPPTPTKTVPPIATTTPRTADTFISPLVQTTLLHRAGFNPRSTNSSTSHSSIVRSTTQPTISRISTARPLTSRNMSTHSTSGASAGTSKGVQMLTEMRARVEVLGQKIHTRVPRIRMGSVNSRTSASTTTSHATSKPGPSSIRSPSTSSSISSLRSASPEKSTAFKPKAQSLDLNSEKVNTPMGNTSGWVLIMEDSPSPLKDKEKVHRRRSGPIAPSAFRPLTSNNAANVPPNSPSESRSPSALSQSHILTGIRRPQSRTSEGRSSVSTNATSSTFSSIPTPISRPTTPTFLPVPTASLYSSGGGAKRPIAPPSGLMSSPKRASMSAIPTRPSGKPIPLSLAQSRIGRPPNSPSSRKAKDAELEDVTLKYRSRMGSGSNLFGRNAY